VKCSLEKGCYWAPGGERRRSRRHASEQAQQRAQRRDHSSWMRLPPLGSADCPASFAAITQAYRWHRGIPSTRRLTCHCRSGNAPPRCLQADPSFPLGSQNRGKYVPGIRICEPGPTTQLRRAPSPTAANAASGPSQPIDGGREGTHHRREGPLRTWGAVLATAVAAVSRDGSK